MTKQSISKQVADYLAQRDRGEKASSPQFKFSEANLNSLPVPDKEYVCRDTNHSGLRVLVKPTGRKVLQLCKKPKGKSAVAKVLITEVGGVPYSKIDSIIHDANELLIQGLNPNTLAKQGKAESMADGVTLKQALDAKLKHKVKGRPLAEATANKYQRGISGTPGDDGIIDEPGYLNDWLNLPLKDITPYMVLTRYEDIADDYPIAAASTFQSFSAVYNFMRKRLRDSKTGISPVPECPTWTLNDNHAGWQKPNKRKNYVKTTQLKKWWKAVNTLNEMQRDYLLFLISTGLRRREASDHLHWASIDFDDDSFTIHQTKNHEVAELPMNSISRAVLERRYAATIGKGKVFDINDPKKFIKRVVNESGVTFSSHDLRRTFRQYGNITEVTKTSMMGLINHKAEGVTDEHYGEVDVELLRKPSQKIADFILKTAGVKKSADILTFKGADNANG